MGLLRTFPDPKTKRANMKLQNKIGLLGGEREMGIQIISYYPAYFLSLESVPHWHNVLIAIQIHYHTIHKLILIKAYKNNTSV